MMAAEGLRCASDDERFWRHVRRGGPDECWLWTGAAGAKGLGSFRREDRTQTTPRRVAYQLVVGEIPEGHIVIATCGLGNCVNPNHLAAIAPGGEVSRDIEPDLVDIFERAARRFYAGHAGGEP